MRPLRQRLQLLAAVVTAAACMAVNAQPNPAQLADDRGCMRCHGMVRKAVGPGFAQIAARYKDDAAAAPRLAGKIRHGAVGAWGRVVMPRQPKVSEAEAQLLAAWVLAQRPP